MGKLVQTGSKVTAKSGFTTTAAKQSGTTAAAKTAPAKTAAAKTAPAVVAQGKSGKLVQTGTAAAKSGFTTTPASGNSAKTADALTAAIVTANQKAAQTAAEKKTSSPMFRTQTGTQQTVTPKTQSTLAQNLAQGALQQQEAKNYQSEEAFQKHVQGVKEPTSAQRVVNTIKGAAKTYGAGLANAGGTVAESQSGTGMSGAYRTQAETLQKQIAALQKTLSDPTMTAKEREETREAIANAQSQLSIYTNALRSGENTASSVYKVADRLQSSGEKDISKAKDRLGSAGRLAVDVGTAGAQMLGDMALGAATGGTALAPMAARVFGSSAQEARNAGATHTQQVNYGLTSAALSAATEKVANVAAPFRKAFGGGVLDSAIDRAMTKMNGSAAGKAALSFLSEGGEEVLEDIVQPVLKSIYNGKSIWKNWSELELADVLYDGLVGGVLGLLGSGAEAVTRGRAAETQDVGAGARQTVNEGNFTPAQENAAEGAQGASAANEKGKARTTRYSMIDAQESAAPAINVQDAPPQSLSFNSDPTVTQGISGVKGEDMQRGGNYAGNGLLQNTAGTDTMSKGTFSLKEELKSGRAREESRDNFLRRASGEGYGILEGDTIAYGYRSDKSILGDETGARQVQKELGALGVNCEITDGTVLWNLNGISGVREIKEAVTVDGKTILINKDTDMPAKQVAGHEAFHLWKRSAAREAYIDAVEDNLDYTSPAFRQYQSAISQAYLGGEADLSNAAQYNKLREELLAYISGDIHEGTNDEFLRPMFRDYDAVKAAWANLAGSQRGGNYAPENHIDNRTAESVAPRSVNAFSFDHPELRGYYVEAAEQIAGIADLSRQYGQQMGARKRTANGYQRTSNIYETPALRAAMNEGLTRSQIIDAADRLIKDHGQENVKAAKTLELILDDMLTNGYTNVAGEQVGPNAAYLAAKAQIDGAQPVQARQAEELPIWDMDVPDDLPGSIGAARAGYQAPDTEPTERTSNLAGSAARYTQAEGEATTRSREDYDELFRYRAQSEEESRAKADDLVYIEKDGERQFLKDADPAAYDDLVQYLSYAPAWNAQMVDAAMLIKEELQGRSIAMEITEDEYTHWLEVMREHATETGRGTQAWAKYSRAGNESGQASEADAWEKLQKSDLSDEERGEKFRSILLYDQRIEKARSPEDLKAVILEIAQERGVLSGITGRQSKSLYRAAEASLGSMDFVQLRQFAYESSAAMASDAQTRDIGKKLKTVQILNMLSNPKTAMKNLAGNTTFYALDMMSMRGAAVLDMALSKLTGTRSVAFEKPVMSRESRESIMKALRLSAAEITMDVDMGASGRYEQSGNRTFKAGGKFAERVLSVCERNMGYLMTATDEAYKGAARGTQRGTQELIEQEKIKNAPKDYAASQADELAKYRTFQNDSKTAAAIQTVHDVLNMVLGAGDSGKAIKGKTVHSFGAGDLVAPFTRVAGNLAGVGLDYSPVNAVKGTVEIVSAVADAAKNGANPVKQAKAVSDLARGMTGTAIAYGFMLLAKEGLLKRADDEDDKDIADLNKSEGMTGAQINLSAARRWLDGDESGAWQYGDTLVDLSNLEPLNFMVSLGADMAQEDSGSILSPFVATKDSILSAAGDLPVLQTVGSFAKDVFKYGTPVEQAAAEAVGKSAISSATPNVLAAIAKGIDEKQRNVYADDGTGDVLIATLKSRIPKVRETLPTTVNTLGEEKSNEGSLAERLINALLNPIGVNRYTQSEVSKEMERVREKTGETGYYPTTRKPDELSYKDSDGKEHTVTLDYDRKQAFQKACATGQMAYTAAMMETDTYKAADDETRAGLLSRCYTYSYEAAKAGVLGDGAVDKWVVHARDAQSELGMSTADYLAALETYGSGVMSGTGFDKTKRMLDAGLSLDDWAKMRESVDADGNGSVKKAELTGYIEANFPQEQWSALFDAYKGGQNWKNPY